MRLVSIKHILIVGAVFVCLGIGVFVYRTLPQEEPMPVASKAVQEPDSEQVRQSVVGLSVEGREIEAYTYGVAPKKDAREHIVFVGGMHGGYEWNSVLLAYGFIDYINEHMETIPKGVAVTIIPSLNPDGVYRFIGKEGRFARSDVPLGENTGGLGRFNANNVDLNRNFDCKWQPKSMWRNTIVDAGEFAFSEPEAAALRDFILEARPSAVVFWHSQANAVYASECENGIMQETRDITNAYAKAAGYRAVDSFDAYEITGDAEGWLASLGIPAITVELETHQTVEWDRNLAGVQALLDYYSVQ